MPPTDLSMQGKVCIITGANSGVGRETARGLARLGASVVMVCRSLERGQAALDDLRADTGSASLDLMICDLSVQASIRQFADVYRARYERLDVLINNAAIIPPRREVTAEGVEAQLAANHLGPFLLTHLLLALLKASAPARIINVASSIHPMGRVDFDDLHSARGYRWGGWGQYANTKLMNILFTRELARRLDGTGVTANCLHPGYIATRLQRGLPGIVQPFNKLLGAPERKGAETPLYLATSPDVASVSGQYFADRRSVAPAAHAQDDALAKRLWDVSVQMVGLREMNL